MSNSISMFIDNELDLDEKITFIKRIHVENEFYDESLVLMEQEKLLRSDVVYTVPRISFKKVRNFFDILHFTPFIRVATAGILAAIFIFFVFSLLWKNEDSISKRFVIYKPEASSVQIAGSFTNWNNIPLKMVGASGYWEIELDVTKGEHKYVFIIGDNKKIADPTILMREKDDFGSENTILIVEA